MGEARNDCRSQGYVEWTLDGLLRHVVYLGGSPQPASLCRDLIPARLAPAILIHDISQRYTTHWPKPAHRMSDRQQGIRMDAGRQPESGLSFLLEIQIQRRQSRAEAERSRRQQHVLDRGIDRRSGRAGRRRALKARDDPDRGLVDVVGQKFRRRQHPLKPLPAGQRWRFLVIRDAKDKETVGALLQTGLGRAGGPTVSVGRTGLWHRLGGATNRYGPE